MARLLFKNVASTGAGRHGFNIKGYDDIEFDNVFAVGSGVDDFRIVAPQEFVDAIGFREKIPADVASAFLETLRQEAATSAVDENMVMRVARATGIDKLLSPGMTSLGSFVIAVLAYCQPLHG